MMQMQSAMMNMRDEMRVSKQTQEQMERVVRNQAAAAVPRHQVVAPIVAVAADSDKGDKGDKGRAVQPPPAPRAASRPVVTKEVVSSDESGRSSGSEPNSEDVEDDKQVSIVGGMKRGGRRGAAAGARKTVAALKLDL
jgi:uncharacterized membrane protein